MSDHPRIVEAEKFGDGVLITFDDGKLGIYPDILLYALLKQTEMVVAVDKTLE
jgi:hypothetical protein